jgi:hypothetical protein
MDSNHEATRLHFENLRVRYGDPIIILNLIKVSLLFCSVCQHFIIISVYG